MLPILLTFWPFLETVLQKNSKYININNNNNKNINEKNINEKNNNFNDNNNNSIRQNFLSAFNAIGTIILGVIYLKTKNDLSFSAVILFPMVFYIYDTYNLWFNRKIDKLAYICHHLAAIYYLQCIFLYGNEMRLIMILALICIELSNLPLYYVYDFLKRNNEKTEQYYKKLLDLKCIQLVFYGICRILVFGYIIYNYSKEVKHQPILLSSIYLIFFMGAYWLQHQIKGYFKTKNEYKELLYISKLNTTFTGF